jgi:hypothetical protein
MPPLLMMPKACVWCTRWVGPSTCSPLAVCWDWRTCRHNHSELRLSLLRVLRCCVSQWCLPVVSAVCVLLHKCNGFVSTEDLLRHAE